jgi:hypothetical protein
MLASAMRNADPDVDGMATESESEYFCWSCLHHRRKRLRMTKHWETTKPQSTWWQE